MKKFDFKLEPLYEYRQRLEEICQREFGEAGKRLDEEEVKLENLKGVYEKSVLEIDELKERSGQTYELDLYYTYIAGLKKHMAEQERIIKACRAELEVKRTRLLSALKDKKVIEVMKEKSLLSYREGLNREDQKITDDLVTSRFKRSEE